MQDGTADHLRSRRLSAHWRAQAYELVAEGHIPCSKVAGKWLFPRHELDRWVMSGLARPSGMRPHEPPPIVGGSQDDLLEWTLRQSGSGLASLTEGTEGGIARLLQGEAAVAAIHFHSEADDANVAAVAAMPRLYDAVLVGFARREQGLLLPPGNPRSLNSLADVIASGARIAARQRGAGADMLLLAAGGRRCQAWRPQPAGATLPPVPTFGVVRTGADCGVATHPPHAPPVWISSAGPGEFDLLMRQRTYFQPSVQALLRFLGEEICRARRRACRLRSKPSRAIRSSSKAPLLPRAAPRLSRDYLAFEDVVQAGGLQRSVHPDICP